MIIGCRPERAAGIVDEFDNVSFVDGDGTGSESLVGISNGYCLSTLAGASSRSWSCWRRCGRFSLTWSRSKSGVPVIISSASPEHQSCNYYDDDNDYCDQWSCSHVNLDVKLLELLQLYTDRRIT